LIAHTQNDLNLGITRNEFREAGNDERLGKRHGNIDPKASLRLLPRTADQVSRCGDVGEDLRGALVE
jgi:hypothetical protein